MIFEKLKQQIMTVLILKHFNSIREAILKTNFSNYVNDEVLSQYDDEDILHSMIFYSKNMILAECNYKIYDKEIIYQSKKTESESQRADQNVRH